MNAPAQPINRIQLGAALSPPAAKQYRYSGLDRTFLVLELLAAPVLMVLAYTLSGSLRLSIASGAIVYALAAAGAGRVRTARRRHALLGTAAIVLGPPGVPIDLAARGLLNRLDHYHRLIARIEMWIIPTMMMVFGLLYAYVYAGSNEMIRQVILDLVVFLLMGALAAAVMQIQSAKQLRKLSDGIHRTLLPAMDGPPPRS